LALLGAANFTSVKVIAIMKSMFSRHGIQELVLSDNGPQYASQEFAAFAEDYGCCHVTSSPHYPRANGAAERAVQSIKNILKKEQDPHLELLAYRSSPLFGMYSPAELLMGCKLRTMLVTHPDDLLPKLPDHDSFKVANNQYKYEMKECHDKNPKIKSSKPLVEGEPVLVRVNT